MKKAYIDQDKINQEIGDFAKLEMVHINARERAKIAYFIKSVFVPVEETKSESSLHCQCESKLSKAKSVLESIAKNPNMIIKGEQGYEAVETARQALSDIEGEVCKNCGCSKETHPIPTCKIFVNQY